jgi:hypothetical protein
VRSGAKSDPSDAAMIADYLVRVRIPSTDCADPMARPVRYLRLLLYVAINAGHTGT